MPAFAGRSDGAVAFAFLPRIPILEDSHGLTRDSLASGRDCRCRRASFLTRRRQAKLIRPSTWLRFHFEYSGDCAPRQISCRYGRTLSPCSWKPLGGTVVVKHIPYGMPRDLLFSSAFPSRVSTLSERRCSGTPFITITSASAEMTLELDQRRSARTSRLSRVCSSSRFRMRTLRPSCVRALTKS